MSSVAGGGRCGHARYAYWLPSALNTVHGMCPIEGANRAIGDIIIVSV